MSTCFKCGAQPPADMIYCLDCGAPLDGEQDTVNARLDPEQETFVSNMIPGLPTFVGSVPIAQSKRTVWALVGCMNGLLIVAVAYIYIGEAPVKPVETLPYRGSAAEGAQHGAVA